MPGAIRHFQYSAICGKAGKVSCFYQYAVNQYAVNTSISLITATTRHKMAPHAIGELFYVFISLYLVSFYFFVNELDFEISENNYSILTNFSDCLFMFSICYELKMANVCLNLPAVNTNIFHQKISSDCWSSSFREFSRNGLQVFGTPDEPDLYFQSM